MGQRFCVLPIISHVLLFALFIVPNLVNGSSLLFLKYSP